MKAMFIKNVIRVDSTSPNHVSKGSPVAISNAPGTRRFAGAQRGAGGRLVTASFSRRSVAAAAVTANASTLIPTSAARHLLQDLDTQGD